MQGLSDLVAGQDLLFEISKMMDECTDLARLIRPALAKIGPHLPNSRLAVSLLNLDTGEVGMEEAFGLTEAQLRQGRYRIGEGIIGKVVESGKKRVIFDAMTEPDFLNRTQDMDQFQRPALICVPIKLENQVIGVFSCMWERQDETPADVDRFCQFLSIFASLLAGAVGHRKSEETRLRLQSQLKENYRPQNLIGNSKAMRQVYTQIGQVCESDTTVLLRGESGVGKELIASAIHYSSKRSSGPFIKVNCGAIPENLLESELFGHERGAFTGAVRMRKGRFEQAHSGTLFLDEIGDVSPGMQVKLLRALQEREFQRVGGDRMIHVDVRIIAASNRDLEELMREEQFRADLFYRLSVFPILIPPLRERKEDISALADYFVAKYNKNAKEHIRRITTPALNALLTYQWPGNVRELQNCMERAVLVAEDKVIHERDLPPSLQTAATSDTRVIGSLEAVLQSCEKELISDAIIEARGNMAMAARILGITERQMGCRVQKYAIKPRAYR